MSLIHSSWSVRDINSLSILKKTGLDSNQIPEKQKEKLKNLFSKLLNSPSVSRSLETQGEAIQFDFDLDADKGFILRLGSKRVGRSIAPFADLIAGKGICGQIYQEIQEVERIVSRAAIGRKLANGPTKREELHEFVFKLENEQREREQKEIEPMDRFFEKANTAVDLNSIGRNTTRAILCAPLPATAATTLSIAAGVSQLGGGVMAIVSGGALLAKGAAGFARAIDRSDLEGAPENLCLAGFGASYLTLGVAFTLDAIDILLGATSAMNTPIWSAAGVVVSYAFIAMSAFQMAHAILKLRAVLNFGEELSSMLDSKKEPNELKRLKGALEWIKSQVTLSEFEVLEIEAKASTPFQARKEIAKKLEGKWDRFERHTDATCGKLVRQTLQQTLSLLEKNDLNGLREAKLLVQEIEKANYKQKISQQISCLIALVGLVAGIVSVLLLGAPVLIPLLFILGALLWLTLDNSKINNWISEGCWERKQRLLGIKHPNVL